MVTSCWLLPTPLWWRGIRLCTTGSADNRRTKRKYSCHALWQAFQSKAITFRVSWLFKTGKSLSFLHLFLFFLKTDAYKSCFNCFNWLFLMKHSELIWINSLIFFLRIMYVSQIPAFPFHILGKPLTNTSLFFLLENWQKYGLTVHIPKLFILPWILSYYKLNWDQPPVSPRDSANVTYYHGTSIFHAQTKPIRDEYLP